MKLLQDVVENLKDCEVHGDLNIKVAGISEDSRTIKKDFLFIAVTGLTVDGHEFIAQAVKNGTTAVVGERDFEELELPGNITYIKVSETRKKLGVLASAFYDHPSEKLKVIGVTGTDGKTTTSSIIYQILLKAGKKVGLISTVSAKIGKLDIDTGFHVTNPDPVLLQKLIANMVGEGCEYAIVEVTSHGLDQERVAGTIFDSAVLTNITREHLDYHRTFENYRDSKLKLFMMANKAIAINTDDPSGLYLITKVPNKVKKLTYGIESKNAHIFASNLQYVDGKFNFDINEDGNSINITTNLLGKYNVSNILAASAICRYYGVTLKNIRDALEDVVSPEGRLEKIKNNKGIEIYVDFAHTPNALENVLTLLSEQKTKSQRLIAVFGCASERDDSKRPIMAEISTRTADISIFTAEDPRREDINKIISEMAAGVKTTKEVSIDNLESLKKTTDEHYFIRIPERGEAISLAINKIAQKGDIVVACGKGHEKSMNYNGIEYPWSDKKAVELALEGKIFEIKHD